ncbi:MAG: MltA domain-containing protein [Elusimicrobia bacterium]|nr:MltA domain-containing protein [Elusimicrobiota bacterium]
MLGLFVILGVAAPDRVPAVGDPAPIEAAARGNEDLDACLKTLDEERARTPPTSSPTQPPPPKPGWRVVEPGALPDLRDSLETASLLEAAARTRAYWNGRSDTVSIGGDAYPAEHVARSLDALIELVRSNPDPAALKAGIEARFRVYQSMPGDGTEHGKATGYYTPHLEIFERGGPGLVPIHGKPSDLGSRRPYSSRREIAEGRIARGSELYWTQHPAEVIELHLEGSGWGLLPGGRRVLLGWAGTNGHGWRSIARSLVACGIAPLMKQPELYRYMKSQPLEREQKIANLDPSYMFAGSKTSGAPTGAIGLAVTGGRSIAVDRATIPLGLPAVLSLDPRAPGQHDFARVVFTHDTGGAIKGGARVDLYWGEGPAAGEGANATNQPCRLFVFVLKPEAR